MRRSLTVAAIIISLLMFSCRDADRDDDGQMAIDYCKCFDKLVSRLSEDTKKMVIDAGNATNPMEFIREYKNSVSEETAWLVDKEMKGLRVSEESNPDQYNKMNEERTLRKIITVLEKKEACIFTASMLKAGLNMKKKSRAE
jgi:hypothetical protein